MKLKIKKQQLIYSICIGILISIAIITALFFGINIEEKRDKDHEKLEVMERFLRFQSQTEATIGDSIHLLEGYMAYVKTNPSISEENSNQYLEHLLLNKETLIRNIGIIKDTTIIWNYPREGNETAIGIDLTKIPKQKEEVLKVKKTLEPMFTGPVDLVQGGTGFISRLPIVIDGEYWGQISIVLDAEKYFKELDKLAQDANLNIAIYNETNFQSNSFYGDDKIIDRNGVVVEIVKYNSEWKFAIEPLDGWEKYSIKIIMFKIVALLLSAIIGFFIYIIQYTRYQLNYQAINDQLTGLNNRHILDYYFQGVWKKAKTGNKFIGIFLIDINDFKKINDNYGHKVGDLVLIEFAKRLSSIEIREKRVFRLGGDEFLILVSGIQDQKDLEYIDKIIKEKSVFRFKYTEIEIDVIPSIGLATYPSDGDTLDKLMNIADTRMYEEKRMTKSKKIKALP